jgi:hypothetical protein
MTSKKKRSDVSNPNLGDLETDNLFSDNQDLDPLEFKPDFPSISETPLPPIGGQIFETAKGDGRPEFPPLPELKRGFQEIVRDLFADGLNVRAEYAEIKDSLTIRGALTPVAIQAAANRVEMMADKAFRLYCVALNEYEAYIREISVIEAALRDAATAELERQKANKSRTKQITEADVLATISQSYPDEWDDLQQRRGCAKGMLDYLNNLSGLAKSRCFSVSKMQRND